MLAVRDILLDATADVSSLSVISHEYLLTQETSGYTSVDNDQDH